MGYDLEWVEPPSLKEVRPHEWQENVQTMCRFRALVHELGMLDEETTGTQPKDVLSGAIPMERLLSNDGWLISASQSRALEILLRRRLVKNSSGVAAAYVDGTVGVEHDARLMAPLFEALNGSDMELIQGRPDRTRDEEIMDAVSRLIRLTHFLDGAAEHGGFYVW